MNHRKKKKSEHEKNSSPKKSRWVIFPALFVFIAVTLILFFYYGKNNYYPSISSSAPLPYVPTEKWLQRAYMVDALFHEVYTPCWEGAYGAIGDAYLFAATHDSSLLRFHLIDHNLRAMCEGTWVDDRAWVCLTELTWYDVTGKTRSELLDDARQRYMRARNAGLLSNREGVWSWYNILPGASVRERVFTNSNMNQMATVACRLFEATKEKTFLDDALLVWNGNIASPGIEQTLYKGNGRWEGRGGLAAFEKQIPWNGIEYCSLAAALYRVTQDRKYREVIVSTAKRMMDPANGWIDPDYFYQIRMDGNGAFVNFLLDAYAVAPDELSGLLPQIEQMLDHVWTNNEGTASVTLHRESDHGIRNGWNPHGGEDGYNVNEVGTVHAQGEAVRAFGTFAYYSITNKKLPSCDS